MITRRRFLSACSALLLCASAEAAPSFPKRIDTTFAAYIGSVRIGEGRDRFEHDGKTYRISSESKTVGVASIYRYSINREVTGRLTPAGLRPETYTETRNGKLKRKVTFDWEARQATLFDGENTQVVPLPDRTWDTTSFGYNFAFLRMSSGEIEVNLTDGRRISPNRYAVVGREQLDTELGKLDTLHVRKVQRPDDPRSFEVWVATERNYAPVRIRYTEKDGTVFDSVATSLSFSSD
jgi:hypothetical protein